MVTKFFCKSFLFILLLIGMSGFASSKMVEVDENWTIPEIKRLLMVIASGNADINISIEGVEDTVLYFRYNGHFGAVGSHDGNEFYWQLLTDYKSTVSKITRFNAAKIYRNAVLYDDNVVFRTSLWCFPSGCSAERVGASFMMLRKQLEEYEEQFK
ncbi:hypothetical protein [Lonepinella sp. BR2271]|uniref:hypothetical protein n=1 Tax=Lonepinella sp. BR2271 TaxID=3434550 RepID=UPI003F6E37D7